MSAFDVAKPALAHPARPRLARKLYQFFVSEIAPPDARLVDVMRTGPIISATGFVDLDEMTTGLQPGDLIIVAGTVTKKMAPVLRRMIFREGCSCVMTSATLSVGRADLAYFRRRIGADEVEPLLLGGPFDFRSQMKMFVVQKMPDPRDVGYEKALEHWIAHFVEETDGRAFVLFTNYRGMQAVADQMREFFLRKKFNLLVQGGGAPRGRLLEQFKATPRSVLFGTDSFWMGVDVPGEALSNVIITRLPFAVPDHPLIEAKLELIEERGGDPFTEYSLPEAILKLRQGVGRLIRTKSDRGIIVILDNRIVTKPYGRAFLQALPKCPVNII